MSATILLADDDRSVRTVISEALTRKGYIVRAAASASTLWEWVLDGAGDLVVTDIFLAGENGLDLIPRIRRRRPGMQVIAMSAQSTMATAVRASERGAFDYLAKPFDLDALISVIERALAHVESGDLLADIPNETGLLVGRSPPMQAIYRTLARISQSDLPVLVSGPAGSGKKVLARTIHEHSKRKAASFVTVNISALGQDFARELFGTVETPGRLARAGAGTLALNDIADMPRAMQTALEDLVERGEYRPVNSKRSEQLAARIISVTGYDAAGLLEREKIRPELFYRLGVVSIAMPALAERLEDIPELAQNLLARMVQEGAPRCRILPEAIAALQAYDWPGNVRELDNVLRNLCVLATDRIIDAPLVRQVVGGSGQSSIKARHAAALSGSVAEHLETYFRTHQDSLPPAGLYDRILAEVEKPLIEKCLAVCNGNQIRAADLLGLNRNTLRKKIRELGIAVSRGESRVT